MHLEMHACLRARREKQVGGADARPRRCAPAAGSGGASRDRTGDLLVANQTLSQLSYGPAHVVRGVAPLSRSSLGNPRPDVVGLGGVEPPTSPLSGVRSNQLSYRPGGFGWPPYRGGPRETNKGHQPTDDANR